MADCPVCRMECEGGLTKDNAMYYDCPNCGPFVISQVLFNGLSKLNPETLSMLSHGIWKGYSVKKEGRFLVTEHVIESAKNGQLPNPAEQIDRLVLFLGETSPYAGKTFPFTPGSLLAKIGSADHDNESFIVQTAEQKGIIDCINETTEGCDILLTMIGWEQFEELQRGAVHSKTAFMAMPFRHDDVKQMVDIVFRPAVAETGFTLRRIDDKTPAGSIDDRIRVEIRMCRLLIADLTYGNQGAYWEAGYAEGLEKPVIYTCSKDYFDSQGTHFDTNHRQTVVWDPADPIRAAKDLKATIRATLPFEAKMEEEEGELRIEN